MTQQVNLGNFKAGQAGAQINVGLLGFKMAVAQTKVKDQMITIVLQVIFMIMQ